MKKIKSMLEWLRTYFKKPVFEHIYQHLKQEVALANQSRHDVWGMLALYLGFFLFSLSWVITVTYQHFYHQDTFENVADKPHPIINLASNRVFLEPPPPPPPAPAMNPGFYVTYQLAGILYDNDVSKREVMLTLPSGEIKAFHVGDVLPDGVKILDIEVFQVKLEKDGQQKSLQLEEYSKDFLSDQAKPGQSLF